MDVVVETGKVVTGDVVVVDDDVVVVVGAPLDTTSVTAVPFGTDEPGVGLVEITVPWGTPLLGCCSIVPTLRPAWPRTLDAWASDSPTTLGT